MNLLNQVSEIVCFSKTNKAGISTRQILDKSSFVQYKFSTILKLVSRIFFSFCIKDFFSFVEVIKKVLISSNMCSFDIKCLSNNISIVETINICLNELYNFDFSAPFIPKDICLSLLNMSLKNVELSF